MTIENKKENETWFSFAQRLQKEIKPNITEDFLEITKEVRQALSKPCRTASGIQFLAERPKRFKLTLIKGGKE